MKCSGRPPVSPSKMMGFVVTSKMSFSEVSREVRSTASMSGFPLETESVRLLDHMASNEFPSSDVVSAMSPVSPLWASIMRMRGLAFSRRFNFDRRIWGVVPMTL